MRLVAAQTEASDLKLNQLKAEADVDQVVTRTKRDQDRLDSGAVSAPKELESLQHEIATLGKRQAELEDVELEIMQILRMPKTQLRNCKATTLKQHKN